MQLLLSCVSGRQDATQQQQALRCLKLRPDAGLVSWLAGRHRMIPQVYETLPSSATKVRARLKSLNAQCTLNNLVMQSEVARIARAFRDAGVPLLVMKGAAVEQQVYPQGQHRQYRDIDLLVKPKDLEAACQVLRRLSYSGQVCDIEQANAAQRKRLIKYSKHVGATRVIGRSSVVVELHWRPGGTPRMFESFMKSDFHIVDSVKIGGEHVCTFPFPESLIYLACHGGRHRWKRLSWLCDFVRAVEKLEACDWGTMFSIADRLKLRPYLNLAFSLVQSLMPWYELPLGADSQLYSNSGMTRVVETCRHAIEADELHYENRPLSGPRWYFELPHCFSDRIHALQSIIAPEQDDILKRSWWGANVRRVTHVVRRLTTRRHASPDREEESVAATLRSRKAA